MADKQIEEFPVVTSPDGLDVVHISRGGADRSIIVSDLIPSVGTSGTVVVRVFKNGIEFTAGTSNALNISEEVTAKKNLWVFFDGVYQEKETYELTDTIVVFNEVIPIGVDTVEIVIPTILDVGQTDAASVSFVPGESVEDLLSQTLVFATASEMVLSSFLQVGYKCATLGYSAIGDGGDNDYQIITAGTETEDGGAYLDIPSSSVQARGLFTSGHRSPKQWGDASEVLAFTDTDATPSVVKGDYYTTTGTTTITDFIDGRVGQTIHVQATDAITIQNNASIVLRGGVDHTLSDGDVLVLTQYEPDVWTEETRSFVVRPVVTGSQASASDITNSIRQALADLDLIDDQTTA